MSQLDDVVEIVVLNVLYWCSMFYDGNLLFREQIPDEYGKFHFFLRGFCCFYCQLLLSFLYCALHCLSIVLQWAALFSIHGLCLMISLFRHSIRNANINVNHSTPIDLALSLPVFFSSQIVCSVSHKNAHFLCHSYAIHIAAPISFVTVPNT